MVRNFITKPIVLVGMMGSGKSTIGRKLAKKLNLKFYDTDKVIEDQEGLSLMDIYDFRGESYFQQQEEKIMKKLFDYGVIVISTGGGTFANQELNKLIKSKAISIWLSADFETLFERVSRRNTRPELNVVNQKEVLERMIVERTPSYSKADIIVESHNFDTHYIVDTVIAKLKKYLCRDDNIDADTDSNDGDNIDANDDFNENNINDKNDSIDADDDNDANDDFNENNINDKADATDSYDEKEKVTE